MSDAKSGSYLGQTLADLSSAGGNIKLAHFLIQAAIDEELKNSQKYTLESLNGLRFMIDARAIELLLYSVQQ